jgi:hypothetical protein
MYIIDVSRGDATLHDATKLQGATPRFDHLFDVSDHFMASSGRPTPIKRVKVEGMSLPGGRLIDLRVALFDGADCVVHEFAYDDVTPRASSVLRFLLAQLSKSQADEN